MTNKWRLSKPVNVFLFCKQNHQSFDRHDGFFLILFIPIEKLKIQNDWVLCQYWTFFHLLKLCQQFISSRNRPVMNRVNIDWNAFLNSPRRFNRNCPRAMLTKKCREEKKAGIHGENNTSTHSCRRMSTTTNRRQVNLWCQTVQHRKEMLIMFF